ncbi:MAG: bifunctional riboflavin kinase/FMN adenylyltransferase [Candidatus Omnitrophota bacterium]
MRVLTALEPYHAEKERPLILGIGNFDGLHLGHQALIRHVVRQAEQLGGHAAILTFQKHPQTILHPASSLRLLISPLYKGFLFETSGIHTCFWLPFTEDFSKLTAGGFVGDLLVKKLRVREVCMGYNAHFGHGREGDAARMAREAERYGFAFEKVEPVSVAGDYVSSSRVRDQVVAGDLAGAQACLGRSFGLLGRVTTGDGRGAGIGYPTLNLETASGVYPPEGVYAVRTRFLAFEGAEIFESAACPEAGEFRVTEKGPWLDGIMNFGRRPTFTPEETEPRVEVHLFDFKKDVYGQRAEVLIRGFIRRERRFQDAEELRTQIARDVLAAKQLLRQPFLEERAKGD